MIGITEEELKRLEEAVAKLNSTKSGITYRLVEIKNTYYIHPQFSSEG